MSCRKILAYFSFPVLKIIVLAIPLSFFDFATDVFWAHHYLTSPVDFVRVIGWILLCVVLTHNFISSFYGISILRRQSGAYPRLWGSPFRRFCTCSLHLLGLGGIVHQLDYLADFISHNALTFRKNSKKLKEPAENDPMPDEAVDDNPPLPFHAWKTRHLESMQVIQAFVESFPQFLLQTTAIFIKWTSGSDTQCFPSESHRHYFAIIENEKEFLGLAKRMHPSAHPSARPSVRPSVHLFVYSSFHPSL